MDYEIIIIEEEIIPLAAEMNRSSNVFSGVGILLVIFIVAVFAGIYTYHCRVKRRRVALLAQRYQKDGYSGWNIGRLNKEIMRLELEAVTEEDNVSELLRQHEPF